MSHYKLIQAFPTLDLRQTFSRHHDDPVLEGNRVRLYASGRAALFHTIKSLALPSGSSILLPDYHCGVEVEAVLRAGCTVDFYRIQTGFSIDTDSIRKKITPQTKGIVAVHYFGFAQDLSDLKDLCRSRDLILIEDCAHALYSQNKQGDWLGTNGDYGLFSMRKTIFMPNGGAVRVNRNGSVLPDKGKPFFNLSLLKSAVRSVLENEASHTGTTAVLSQRLLDLHHNRSADTTQDTDSSDDDLRWYYDVAAYGYEHDIAALSLACAGRYPYKKIITRRRQNYAALEKLLAPRLADRFVMNELPAGACPLCFPLSVTRRDEVAAHMTKNHVVPFVFGRTPHPLLEEAAFPESKTLADRIIGLPVHQQLNEQDMSVVADSLFNSLER